MAIKLGEIFVSLGLSTASFTTNLDKAKNLCFGNAKEMERSFKIISSAVVSVGGAFAVLAKQSIDLADRTGKLAQSTGMSVQNFSALAYAANRSDIETGTLAKGLVILAKNLEKANQQTLEGRAAHSALSTLFHGAIPAFKDTSDAFQQIAAKLSLLPDGFQKTALAAQIFGKNGAALIPMLGTLDEMTDRARRLGVVISSDLAAKAERFNETLKDVRAGGQAFGLQLASELLPHLQRLAGQFLEVREQAQGWGANLQVVKTAVQLLATGVAATAGALRELGNLAGVAFTALWAVFNTSASWDARKAAMAESTRQLNDSFRSSVEAIQGLWTPAVTAMGEATKPAKQGIDELGDSLRAAREKIAKFTQSLQDQIFEHTHNVIAINEYKAAQLGANAADQAAIAILSRKLFFLDLQKKALEHPKLPAAAPITMDNLPSFAGERLQAQLAPPPGLMFGMPESIQRAAEEARSLQTALVGVSKTPLKPLSDQMRDLALGTKVWGERSLESLGDWIVEGGSFRKMLAGILSDFAKMIVQIIVIGTLKRMFNSLLGNIFGFAEGGVIPGRASGGPVFGGPFLVGERGPELFMPPASGGMIVPHNRLPDFGGIAGTMVVNNYNIDNRGADIGTTAKTAALLDRFSIEQYHRMVLDREARIA